MTTEFSIPTLGSTPFNLTQGPDGALWFTEFLGNKIGRITTSGVITEFMIPTSSGFPQGITTGPDGDPPVRTSDSRVGQTNNLVEYAPLALALAAFEACKASALDVTPPPEAPTLTPVAGEAVSPEWDTSLQLAAEWGGINLDHAVEVVTAMVGKLPIERVHYHFSKVAKLHRSGPRKLELVERAIAKELADLHPAQGDLFAPSPGVWALGARSPAAWAAPPPQALVFDLAALREYAAQIATWKRDLDGPTAQRVAREWMAAAGVKRLRQLFANVGPRKRSGAAKFAWVEERVANPRPLRQGRRQARGSRS